MRLEYLLTELYELERALPQEKTRALRLVADIIALIKPSESQQNRPNYTQLREKLRNAISFFSTIGKTPDVFFKALQIVTLNQPYNKCNKHGKPICPILLEPLDTSNTSTLIVLADGYIYDETALITWFVTSNNYLYPTTNAPLFQFDKQQVCQRSALLTNRDKRKELFNKKWQTALGKFENNLLTGKPEIISALSLKQSVFKLMYYRANNKPMYLRERKNLHKEIKSKIKALGIKQQPDLFSYRDKRADYINLSNIDLSSLMFDFPFSDFDLRGANLSNATFFSKKHIPHFLPWNSMGINLSHAKFVGGPISLKGVDFTNANLQYVDFSGAMVGYLASVSNANLYGAFSKTSGDVILTGQKLSDYFLEQEAGNVEKAGFLTEVTIQDNSSTHVADPLSTIRDYLRLRRIDASKGEEEEEEEESTDTSSSEEKISITLEQFKAAYLKNIHSVNLFARNPLSSIKAQFFEKYFPNMRAVRTYAEANPESRTAEVLDMLEGTKISLHHK